MSALPASKPLPGGDADQYFQSHFPREARHPALAFRRNFQMLATNSKFLKTTAGQVKHVRGLTPALRLPTGNLWASGMKGLAIRSHFSS